MKLKYSLFTFIVLLIMGSVFLSLNNKKKTKPIDIMSVLSEEDEDSCFSNVTRGRTFVFLDDLGPHPLFKTEWWYYTGNLDDDSGNHYGYQFTIFRRAVACEDKFESKWGTNQIYLAHFAITDVSNNQFYPSYRMNRGSTGISGAQSDPYKVWIENWNISGKGNDVFLNVQDGKTGITLSLSSQKPILLQGDNGFSKKSDGAGRASYYFSQTRFKTDGTIQINDKKINVTGLSWFDKEWSTKALGPDDAGWDWFSIQLNDMDITICKIRKKDGSKSKFSYGALVFKDGTYKILKHIDFSITRLESWKSPETKIKYPSLWKLVVPSEALEFTVKPYINNQEHTGEFSYWEGAVSIVGENISGHGYVELTGY